MKMGTKLRKLREEQGFSQEYVANEIGISQSTYYKLEAEQIRLTVERAKQLAKLYEIDPEYFYTSEASAIYYNNGQGHYQNSIHNIEKYESISDKLNIELFSLLKEELLQSRKERERFALLIENLLRNQKEE